ncbi:hypothetical protein Avbf_14004 [Armadillidium vulgare]|nr:hypothetical protein Avbf_14004 [Armadillidium vulgare]
MEIFIDDRKVLTKQLEGYDMKSNEIYWKIMYNEEYTKGYETNEPDVLYYVQFQCPGFDDSSHHLNFGNESPIDHNEYESADLSPAFESPSTVHHDDHRPNERPFIPRGENNTPTEDHPNHPETNLKNSTKPSSSKFL